MFLWSENVGETSPDDVIQPLLAVAGAVALLTLVAGLFVDRRRVALVLTPVVLGALLYGYLADLTGQPAEVRHAAWGLIVLVALVAAFRLGAARLAAVDRALLGVGSILLALPLIAVVPYEVEEALAAPPPVLVGGEALETETAAPKRDVYWLVYDRYGSDRSFELQFGVRNDMTPWLRERGFTVLDDSHANYVATALSLSTTLNMAHLEELTGLVNSDSSSYAPLYARLQGSQVVQQFKALGYRYHHLGSWWNPTRTDDSADRNYNADGVSDFSSVVLEESAWPLVVETFDLEEEPPSESVKHLKHNSYALNVLDRLPREPGPKFVFAHMLLPHPPYVFDRDGRYIPVEEAATIDTADGWERQLDYTNARLRSFLEGLLALPPDEQPIIILQADEGPWTDPYGADKVGYDWTTATPEELEIKFGIMNAWYVPGADLDLDPTMTAINTFPVLFNRYYGLDYELLPDRVAASGGWNRPFRLIDVTELLPSLR